MFLMNMQKTHPEQHQALLAMQKMLYDALPKGFGFLREWNVSHEFRYFNCENVFGNGEDGSMYDYKAKLRVTVYDDHLLPFTIRFFCSDVIKRRIRRDKVRKHISVILEKCFKKIEKDYLEIASALPYIQPSEKEMLHLLNESVWEWYRSTYPEDVYFGEAIADRCKFKHVFKFSKSIWNILGIGSKKLRQRVFKELSHRFSIPYREIYRHWQEDRDLPFPKLKTKIIVR